MDERSSDRRDEVSPEDFQRIERFLAGELSSAEQDAFARWAEAQPARGRLIKALVDLWAEDAAAQEFDLQAMWARTLRRIRDRRRVLSLIRHSAGRTPARVTRRQLAAVAAVVLAAVGAVGGLAVRWYRQRPNAPLVAMRDFTTRRGQRADLRLDDGTQLVLGAATTVRIPQDYGDRTRDVYLDGEAYFVVRHDAIHPFVVYAGHAMVRDVGTRFVVTAYHGTSSMRVVVAEGEVSVAHVEVRRNELAVVDSSGLSAAVTRGVDTALAIGWTRGRLAFEAAPFRDVAASLSRWYDLDIEVADQALGDQPLSVTFASESTHQVLDAIALLTHARYEQRGRTVTFYPAAGP
jgi:transmembrane sensor